MKMFLILDNWISTFLFSKANYYKKMNKSIFCQTAMNNFYTYFSNLKKVLNCFYFFVLRTKYFCLFLYLQF